MVDITQSNQVSQTQTLLSMGDVVAVTSLSRATIHRRIKVGEFPAQVQVSARRVAWRSDDVYAFVNAYSNPQTQK